MRLDFVCQLTKLIPSPEEKQMQALALILEILGAIALFAIACSWSEARMDKQQAAPAGDSEAAPPAHSLPLTD
ncbi:hypothetical protein [Chitinilyticum piscinae]|uniref:Uncharacterized protein n=1 Tax=Chitinilyticum piscinae TaxID=2866724 RepID=A0A8J7FQF2_9NEIS|nr:hypothetical protein [Chitinilyticum piscinae]MBE9608796.1 hypothetical protein [Chitinilyticum piscinae]